MSGNSREEKAALRRNLQEEARKRSAEERAAASHQLCDILRAQPLWQRARRILFYVAISDEPDLTPLLHEAIREGKTAALPRFSTELGHYVACAVCEPSSELSPGRYGIPEPVEHCPIVELNKLDLLLVPGVGFALNGRRLGRGKGYYDRLLAEAQGRKCGVAFDWQVTAEVPAERHDIRLDCVVTPTRWHEVASTGSVEAV